MTDHEMKAKLVLDKDYVEDVVRAANEVVAALGRLKDALRVEEA